MGWARQGPGWASGTPKGGSRCPAAGVGGRGGDCKGLGEGQGQVDGPYLCCPRSFPFCFQGREVARQAGALTQHLKSQPSSPLPLFWPRPRGHSAPDSCLLLTTYRKRPRETKGNPRKEDACYRSGDRGGRLGVSWLVPSVIVVGTRARLPSSAREEGVSGGRTRPFPRSGT